MKKIAFLLIIGGTLCMASCKKNYTCTCSTTPTGGGITTTSVTVIPNATQNEAATICVAGEAYQQGGTQVTKCSL